MAVLEDAADPHRERLAAGVTLSQARTTSFPRQAADSFFVAIAAMRANRSFRPQVSFDVSKGGFFVVEMSGAKDWISHRNLLMASILSLAHGVVKCNVAN